MREAQERAWNAIEQHVRRETWQDDLERKDKLLDLAGKELKDVEERNRLLQEAVEWLEHQLAEKEAEIVRLTTLLEAQAKRRRS